MRRISRIGWTLAVALAAAGARAQDPAAGEARAPALPAEVAQERSLADLCTAALRGELRADEAPADLHARCEQLLRDGEAVAAGGTGREPLGPGESVRAAFTDAGRELVGRRPSGLGVRARGPVTSTLVTNPIGWFSGLGMNAEYSRPFEAFPKASWVAGARFSRTQATNGEVMAFGVGAGADLFVFGRRNEGLRIGPRLELGFGGEDIQGRTTFGRLGASGELGYTFIATNGITASAAGGIGGRLAGDSKNESFESFTGGELGPYLKLGLGYSW
jgi:hypothetical protein